MPTADMISTWREWTNEKQTGPVPDATALVYLQSGVIALNQIAGYYVQDVSIALVAEQGEYPLTADQADVFWVEWNGRQLKMSSQEEWRGRNVDWRNGRPDAPDEFAVYGRQLILYPRPSTDAVGISGSMTVRSLLSPPDLLSIGPSGLSTQDQRIPCYWAAAEWAATQQNNAFTFERAKFLLDMFHLLAAQLRDRYRRREIYQYRSDEPPITPPRQPQQ